MRQIVKIAQATHRSSKLTQYASDLRVRCGNVAIAAIHDRTQSLAPTDKIGIACTDSSQLSRRDNPPGNRTNRPLLSRLP